ncbi:MAG: hypothetical protein CMM83_03710, partial [Rhodospirillales bacterium]|nr:hypothetical protein [Rhodospirillales bacterium]
MAKRPNKKAKTAGRKPRKSKYKFIKVSKRNNTCSIQLNRPDFLNAINIEMSQEISNVLIEAETDRKI